MGRFPIWGSSVGFFASAAGILGITFVVYNGRQCTLDSAVEVKRLREHVDKFVELYTSREASTRNDASTAAAAELSAIKALRNELAGVRRINETQLLKVAAGASDQARSDEAMKLLREELATVRHEKDTDAAVAQRQQQAKEAEIKRLREQVAEMQKLQTAMSRHNASYEPGVAQAELVNDKWLFHQQAYHRDRALTDEIPVPYGFEGVPGEVLRQAQKRAAAGRAYLLSLQNKSCAVVGNSGDLLGRHKGRLIDAHDIVYRFNGAPTEGFEADVGSKTTFRAVYMESYWEYLDLIKKRKITQDPKPEEHFLFTMYKLRDWQWFGSDGRSPPGKYNLGAVPPGHLHVMHPSLVHLAVGILKGKPNHVNEFRHSKWTSSGFLYLLHAIHTCKRVTLFGYSPGAKCSHYWTKCTKIKYFETGPVHDFQRENNFIREVILKSPSTRVSHGDV